MSVAHTPMLKLQALANAIVNLNLQRNNILLSSITQLPGSSGSSTVTIMGCSSWDGMLFAVLCHCLAICGSYSGLL